MGRGRSTLILFAVLLALGGYIYFVEWKKPADADAETKEKVFTVDSGKIAEIQVTSSGGAKTSLQKREGRWHIVSPVSAPADEAEVSGITSNLSTLELQRVVDESPKDLAQYGLDAPKVDVAFKAEGEGEFRHLLLGSKTPTGGDMYARRGNDPRVFLVSGFVDTTFDRSTFDLRSKSVLRVERDALDAVEVRAAGPMLRFQKSGDTWRMTSPVAARADDAAVEALVGRIANGQMRSIVSEDGAKLAAYGLARPEYTVVLSAGSATSTFLVGKRTDEGQYYAKDASRPIVFTVDSFLVEDLKKEPADFRPRDLFAFRTFSGTRVELVRDGATVVFEKRKGAGANDPEQWTRVQPAAKIEETKILDALSKLTNLRADTFVNAVPPGATQAAQVKARPGEGKEDEVVTFFRAEDTVYATRSGDPGAATVATGDFDEALKAFEAAKAS